MGLTDQPAFSLPECPRVSPERSTPMAHRRRRRTSPAIGSRHAIVVGSGTGVYVTFRRSIVVLKPVTPFGPVSLNTTPKKPSHAVVEFKNVAGSNGMLEVPVESVTSTLRPVIVAPSHERPS